MCRDQWLLGVGAFLWVAVAHWTGQEYLHRKENLEVIALGLAMTASVFAFVRVVKTDEPYRLLLFAVTLCVFCRKCHWEWTTRAVFVGLGMVAIWGLVWLKKLSAYTDAHPKVWVWLISTAVMDVVSQIGSATNAAAPFGGGIELLSFRG